MARTRCEQTDGVIPIYPTNCLLGYNNLLHTTQVQIKLGHVVTEWMFVYSKRTNRRNDKIQVIPSEIQDFPPQID